MKRLIISLLAYMWLGSVLCLAQPFFCDVQGRSLEYRRTYVSDGRLKWTHTMQIGSVAPSSGGRKVEYNSTFRKPGGGLMYGGPIGLEAVLTDSGDVLVDVGESLAAVFSNLLPGSDVSSDGARSVLPAAMKPGDVLPDASCTVKAGPLQYKVSVTQRKVLRRETLKTPAGEFECIVVSEHKLEKGPGRKRETTAHTWYSSGVGMVRHDTYDKKLRLETSELLCRIF